MTVKRINVRVFMLAALLGSYGIAELHHGDPIPNGGVIRLTHWATGKNLACTQGRVSLVDMERVSDGSDNWIIQMLPMIGCLQAGREITGNQRVRFKHVISGLTLHYNDQGIVMARPQVDGDESDVWYVRNDGSPEIGGSLRFETFVPHNSLQRCGGVLPENEVTVQSSRLYADEQIVSCSTMFDDNDWWEINPPAKSISANFSVLGAWRGKAGTKIKDMVDVTEQVRRQLARDGRLLLPCVDNFEHPSDQETIIKIAYKESKTPVFFAASDLSGFTLTAQDVRALADKGLFDGSGYWPGRRPISVSAGKTFTIVHPALLNERRKNEMYLCVEPHWDDRIYQKGPERKNVDETYIE